MSCCGNRRSEFRALRDHNRQHVDTPGYRFPGPARGPRVVFEHTGHGRAVVIGPVSGNRYHFDGAGSRVEVDPRDRRGLASLAQLQQVT